MAVHRRLGRLLSDVERDGGARLLGTVAVGWFLVLGMRFVIPAILPTISAEFRIDNTAAGLTVTVLWISYALMQFPTGALVDRVGERSLLVAATLLAGVALLAFGVSPVFPLFLVATAAFGFGTGMYGPSRGTLLSRSFQRREGVAFGVVMAAGSVGAAGLPALAAFVTVRYGWRTALVAAAPVFLLVAVALWRTVPPRETAPEDRSLLADLRTAGAALRERRVALAVLGLTAMLFAFQAVTAFLTTYLVDVRSFSQTGAGALLSLLFVGGAVSQTATGVLADRFGTPRVLTAVALCSVVPLVAIPLVDSSAVLALLATGIGLRMSAGPLSNAYVVDSLPDAVEGTAWGALRTGFFAVGSFGSTLVGLLADRGLFAESFYLLAAITAVAAVAYWFLPERE